MVSLNIIQCKNILSDFQHYIGYIDGNIVVDDIIIVPYDLRERMIFIANYRAGLAVQIDANHGLEIVVGILHQGENRTEIPIKEFIKLLGINYVI